MITAFWCHSVASRGRDLFVIARILIVSLAVLFVNGDAIAQTSSVESTLSRYPDPPIGPEQPIDEGEMESQFVPATMEAGGLYTVTIYMVNWGTTVWHASERYVLAPMGEHAAAWGVSQVVPDSYVPNGSVANFTFQVRAPSVPGIYSFEWGMRRGPTHWFGSPTTPVSVAVSPRPLVNNAAYISHHQVVQMTAGMRYDVSVTMHNNGETTWSRALQYTLMSQAPHNNMTWGVGRVPLPVEEVRPGESVTFNFQVTAPQVAGIYLSQWGMQREGYGSFGASTNAVPVGVVTPPPLLNSASVVGMSAPPRMITGQRYDVAVTMLNNGTTTWVPGTGYSLGSLNPHNNETWGLGRVALATTVAPGQQYTFAFPVSAPAAGSYSMQWGMVQDGAQWFGSSAVSTVTVTEDFSRVTFIHTDGLGSPVARTDGSGNVINRTRYEPYGYVASGATPTVGFTGHVNDADTGLTYMQQRYYDPVAGRFMSIDPVNADVATGGGFNRYSYANNGPYKYIDPDGRFAFLIPLVPYIASATVAVVGHYVLPGRQGREETARAVGHVLLSQGGGKDTLRPGEHAGKSVPARGPDRDFSKGERAEINEIGEETGYHTCGTKDPGTSSGNFVPDHQPPSSLNPNGGAQALYPHCLTCSRTQGGQVRGGQSRSPQTPKQERPEKDKIN